MDKDARKVLREAKQQGFDVRTTKRGHPAVYRDGEFIATYSGTPGDRRAIRNFIAALRRAGFIWPPPR